MIIMMFDNDDSGSVGGENNGNGDCGGGDDGDNGRHNKIPLPFGALLFIKLFHFPFSTNCNSHQDWIAIISFTDDEGAEV